MKKKVNLKVVCCLLLGFLSFSSQLKADSSDFTRMKILLMKNNYWLGFKECVKNAPWKSEGYVMEGYGYSILDLDLTAKEPENKIPMFKCSDIELYGIKDVFSKQQHIIGAIEARYEALMMGFQSCFFREKEQEVESCLLSIKEEASAHHQKGYSQKYKDFLSSLSSSSLSQTGDQQINSLLERKNRKFVSTFEGFDFLVELINMQLSSETGSHHH